MFKVGTTQRKRQRQLRNVSEMWCQPSGRWGYTTRKFCLAWSVVAAIVSLSTPHAQADNTKVKPSDLCTKDRYIIPQFEVDAGFIAKSLRDGFVKVRPMIKEYLEDLQKKDNFSNEHDQPYFSHLQVLYTAVFCADPNDISATRDPKDGSYYWTVDYWRADINQFFEEARGHILTPSIIASGNHALNSFIKPERRDEAIAQFNTRALNEKQPMRIGYDAKRELELRAVAVPGDTTK